MADASGYAFVSYARSDADRVGRLQQMLEEAGIRVWRDTAELWPGEDWRIRIRQAITQDALAFIACFSSSSISRERSYQNEEILLAIDQLRLRRLNDPWLIPVRFDDCVIPDHDLGGGRTLASIHHVDLFGDRYYESAARLAAAVQRIFDQRSNAQNIGKSSRSSGSLSKTDPKLVINAAMLGATGVGKTTLLTSIYDCFGRVIGSVPLDVEASRATRLTLEHNVEKLMRMPREILVTAGLDGTAEIRQYDFSVGATGQNPSFRLSFLDYPGSYLTDHVDHLGRIIAASDVILLAIDAPSLMERNGQYHEVVNRPTQVMDEIKRILADSSDDKLIVLAPIKSETYLADLDSTRRLVARTIEEYRPFLEHISRAGIRERVGCVLTAVQTIGPIRLQRVDEIESWPLFHFCATRRNATYAPVDTDQPLRYLLRFVVNKYRTNTRPAPQAILDRISGVDKKLISAVDTFAESCKTTSGCVVQQGHPFLERGSGLLK